MTQEQLWEYVYECATIGVPMEDMLSDELDPKIKKALIEDYPFSTGKTLFVAFFQQNFIITDCQLQGDARSKLSAI